MNKRMVVITSLFAIFIMAVPMVSAVPWDRKPNKLKWEDYDVVAYFSVMDIALAPFEYVPSSDNVKKAIKTWEENMLFYEITVDGKTYDLDDFDYIGTATLIYYDPVFLDPDTKTQIDSYSFMHAVWNIKYDFGDDGVGLDGEINVNAIVSSREGMHLFSKECTGDFKNVNIQATQGDDPELVELPLVNFAHIGVVKGWPE
jgi:hypothetical protein